MKRLSITSKALFALSLGTALSSPVLAQAEAEDDQAGIADIVVTARKTEESLQTTPVAVSAFSGADLEKQQIVGVTQLQTATPNLNFSSAVAQPGSATIFMRGQGSSDGLMAIDQAIGAYVNGVYLARSTGGAFDMVDIQRVEVLRGPQGTLFGRNTTGGAINIIPNEPTGELGGSLRADAGNYKTFLVRGVLNVPISGDDIGLRVAAQHREHGGYGRDLVDGQPLNDANSEYIRATLKFAPAGSGFKALLSYDWSDFVNNGELVGLGHIASSAATRDTLVAVCNGNAPIAALNALQPLCSPAARGTMAKFVYGGPGGQSDIYAVNQNVASYGKSRSSGFTGILEYEFSEAARIKSTTAWRRVDLDSLSDNDGTPFHFTGGFTGSFGNRIKQRQFSQELQLSGKLSMVEYILGGFYFVENGSDVSRSGSLFPLSTAIGFNDATVRNRSAAGFGQLIFNATDALRITAGLRYTSDKRGIEWRNRNESFTTGVQTSSLPANLLDGDPNDPFRVTRSRTYTYWSWLGSVDYKFSDSLFAYAKVSRSQRSGGFNTRITGGAIPPISFLPERVTDYELGLKLDLFDGKGRINLAAFNSNVDNVQRNVIGVIGTTLTSGIDNAAKARLRGLELEATFKPVQGLTLGGTLGYTDAKYTKFINSIDLTDWSDTKFHYAPEYTLSIKADYEQPVGDGTLKLHADYGWRSEQWSTAMALPASARTGLTADQIAAGNKALQDTALLPSYGLLNARIAYQFDKPNVEIAFYAQNITKTKYFTRLLALENTPFGLTSYMPGDPRTYGVSASIKF